MLFWHTDTLDKAYSEPCMLLLLCKQAFYISSVARNEQCPSLRLFFYQLPENFLSFDRALSTYTGQQNRRKGVQTSMHRVVFELKIPVSERPRLSHLSLIILIGAFHLISHILEITSSAKCCSSIIFSWRLFVTLVFLWRNQLICPRRYSVRLCQSKDCCRAVPPVWVAYL